MIIGIPREIKNHENRVALTPSGAVALVNAGHSVWVETKAGEGSGFSDSDFKAAGVKIVEGPADVWKAEMVIKVKEPLPSEFDYFRDGLILFTFLHLAAEPKLAFALTKKKVTAIAYETIEVNRTLPLLTPMSEIAGRMAAQIGASLLEKTKGGKGILLSGVPGVKRGKVTIIGGGVVGTNAAKISHGLGADVTVLDLNLERLRYLDDIFQSKITTIVSNQLNISTLVSESDLVIGAVLIPGAKAPRLVNEETIKTMKPGSVIVDVAIDQGGIFETANSITTHDRPTYVKHGIIHYAVANMPGAVPRTSTIALTNTTIPYAIQIANKGLINALLENTPLQSGVNTINGYITHSAVAIELGYEHFPINRICD